MGLSDRDQDLIAALAEGLPTSPRPFDEIGRRVGLSEAEVIARLERLRDAGIISRFGVIVRHHELGYRANAMAVWDVPDALVDSLGKAMRCEPDVTLCYRRVRRPPVWPYNLFCMIHGRDRRAVSLTVRELSRRYGLDDYPHEVLFSRRRFKQRGAAYGRDRLQDRRSEPGTEGARP